MEPTEWQSTLVLPTAVREWLDTAPLCCSRVRHLRRVPASGTGYLTNSAWWGVTPADVVAVQHGGAPLHDVVERQYWPDPETADRPIRCRERRWAGIRHRAAREK